MAFTGTPVIKEVSDRLFRITGLSLAAGAVGTIGLDGGTGEVDLIAPQWNPYALVSLQDAIQLELGQAGAIPAGGGGGASTEFYGLTAGTGNPTSTDYAGTIAAGSPVPFPRLGPTGGVATLASPTTFLIVTPGTYKVDFAVHTTEPGQLQLSVNDGAGFVVQFTTTMANMNPTAGGHPIQGSVLITTTTANAVLMLINPAGNTPALTITPADGSRTHANAQTLVITAVAASASGASGAAAVGVVKTGTVHADFLATLTAEGATGPMEIYVEFH